LIDVRISSQQRESPERFKTESEAAGLVSEEAGQREPRARVIRKSPLKPVARLCPKCLKPLKRGSKLGGWLVPQDYYCESCGYRGIIFLERDIEQQGKPEEKQS
jgi:hypothetical protein